MIEKAHKHSTVNAENVEIVTVAGNLNRSSARLSSFSKLLFLLSGTWARTHGVRVLRPCPADCETQTATAQRRGRTHARAARKAKPSVRQAACKLIRVSISVN